MSYMANSRAGHAATIEGLSFDLLGDLLERAHGDSMLFFLLRSLVEIHGIKRGSLESLVQKAKRFTEGIAFSERAEVRWKTTGAGELSALVLTESEEVSDRLGKDPKEFKVAKLGGEFTITFYGHEGGDESEVVSPAKFWTEYETRLPKGVEYPDELFLIYAVYCDAHTRAAQFTRLLPKLKAQVREERNRAR
jgi:hypothetical protein